MHHILLRIAFVAVAAVGIAPAAAAAGTTPDQKPKPPSQVAAISQYEEVLPTASGGHVTQGQPTSPAAKVSQSVQQRVARSGGKDASTLLKIASSSQYGAPSTKLSRSSGRHAAATAAVRKKQSPAQRSHPQQVAASHTSTGSGSGLNGSLIALVVALAILTAGAAAVAVMRRRAR